MKILIPLQLQEFRNGKMRREKGISPRCVEKAARYQVDDCGPRRSEVAMTGIHDTFAESNSCRKSSISEVNGDSFGIALFCPRCSSLEGKVGS